MKNLLLSAFVLFILMGCTKKPEITLVQFDPMANFNTTKNNLVEMKTDLTNAREEGFRFPTIRQTEAGKFIIKFQLKNHSKQDKNLFYKIYYQNESYKFALDSDNAFMNFYGSWQDVKTRFKPLPVLKAKGQSSLITDSIQIAGNPRDEKKYYGPKNITKERIAKKVREIRNNPKWFEKIKIQAEKNNTPLDKTLEDNALYVLNLEKETNYRKRRNPRAGTYSFLLVVVDSAQLNRLPDHVKNIGEKTPMGTYTNPYKYFLFSDTDKRLVAQIANKQLKTRMVFSPDNGIVSRKTLPKNEQTRNCGDTEKINKNAHFAEFWSDLDWKKTHKNIPVIDNIDSDYTREVFRQNAEKYPLDTFVHTYTKGQKYRIEDGSHAADSSCVAVKYDATDNSILVINKGNDGTRHPRKQNAGVSTRFGFTYGRVIGKIKFPKQLNKHNVWNGVTNAFWLIKESGAPWNNRSKCETKGYKDRFSPEEKFVPFHPYSEIDFEIVKASKYIDSNHRKEAGGDEDYDPALTENISIACTNHDLACRDPKNYDDKEIEYAGKTFRTHRWTDDYHARFLKTQYSHSEMYDRDFYYFEIGWYPDSIVWKVGPDMENMTVVGYNDYTISKIPDNQMIAIVTQEFHHGDWWPTTPFHQNNIPYPKDDIVGRVYEIRVE